MHIFIITLLINSPLSALATDSLNTPKKLMVLDFWASWCGPCEESFPKLETLSKKYSNDVEFKGLNQDPDEKDMTAFLKRVPTSFEHFRDTDKKWLKFYQIKALPTTVLTDSQGKEIFRIRGYRSGDESKLEKEIKSALDQNKELQKSRPQ